MPDEDNLPAKFRSKFVLEATVFICGALVMVYEIIGSRLLSPYLGASTYVWTSLIGVILGALSLGYWLGGKIADRKPDVKVLAAVIFLAGGTVSATILLKVVILSFIAQMPFGLEIKSIVAALLLFAPAGVLLGFVTPYAVKLKMSTLEDSGKTVGRLYALSTVGSILGTFLAGFFLIPFVGSERTLYLVGGTLLGLSILLAPFAVTKLNIAVLVLFVMGISASELQTYYLLQTQNLHDIDTEYSRLQIFEMVEPESGKPMRVITFDPFFIQSGMFLDSDEPAFDYIKYYHLLKHFKPDFQKTLLIGGAGYTFPKDYLAKYPNAEIEVAEIDPQMTAIAEKYFRLEKNPRLKIFHEDGRIFLNQAAPEQYDAVFLDAFGSLSSIPFQLTTTEAVRHLSRVTKKDGVVIFNLISAIKGDSSRFLQAELKTYRQVFPRVYLFKIHPENADEKLQNLIIIACQNENTVPPTSPDPQIARLLNQRYPEEIKTDLAPLTDDLAPVEYYNSFAQNNIRR